MGTIGYSLSEVPRYDCLQRWSSSGTAVELTCVHMRTDNVEMNLLDIVRDRDELDISFERTSGYVSGLEMMVLNKSKIVVEWKRQGEDCNEQQVILTEVENSMDTLLKRL